MPSAECRVRVSESTINEVKGNQRSRGGVNDGTAQTKSG